MVFLVPARVGGGIAQAESPAEIDDLGAGVEQGGCEFHGDIGGRGKKHEREFLGLHGLGRGGNAADGFGGERLRVRRGILAMFEQHRLGVRVVVEQADEFSATVATEADDADGGAHG